MSVYQTIRQALEARYMDARQGLENAHAAGNIEDWQRYSKQIDEIEAAKDWFYALARTFKEANL